MRSQPYSESFAVLESLEQRLFLSATPAVATLATGYTGQFRTSSGDPHFPLTAGSTTSSRSRLLTLAITSQTPQGALNGTASIAGLGNFSLIGNTSGKGIRLVLSGDGSGVIAGTLSGTNVALTGSLYDVVGVQQISGSFTAVPSATAVTGNASLNFVANAAGGTQVNTDFFGRSDSAILALSKVPAALSGSVTRNSLVTINIAAETIGGAFNGTIGITGVGTLPFSGVSSNGTTTIVFQATGVSGQIVSRPRANTIGNGSITLNVNGSVLSGSLHALSIRAAGTSGNGSLNTPLNTTLLNTSNGTSAGGSSGALAPVATPITAPVSSIFGGSSNGFGTLGGSFSNSTLTGTGLTSNSALNVGGSSILEGSASGNGLSSSLLSGSGLASSTGSSLTGTSGALGSTSFSLSNPFVTTTASGLSNLSLAPTGGSTTSSFGSFLM